MNRTRLGVPTRIRYYNVRDVYVYLGIINFLDVFDNRPDVSTEPEQNWQRFDRHVYQPSRFLKRIRWFGTVLDGTAAGS